MVTRRKDVTPKDVIAGIEVLAVQLAVDIHPYFLEHHNQILKATEPTWQKCEEREGGHFYHFTLHVEGGSVYSLDFMEQRTESWPYGVRVCALERH